MRNRFGDFILLGLVAAICGFAIQASVRRALAERWIADPTLETLEQAVRLTPGNSAGWVRLGAALANRGDDPVRALEAIRKGVDLGPYNPEAWIALALRTEAQGDVGLAEQYLTKAFEVDRGFDSRWALANFYLRQGQTKEFWYWIRETIAFAPRGFEPGVELCWRAFEDHTAILENAIADDPDLNRRYFHYLLDSNRIEAAAAVWERLKDELIETDRKNALRLLKAWKDQGLVAEALGIWNRLIRFGLIAYAPLSVEAGTVLTNADLRQVPTGEGFDWELTPSGEIRPDVKPMADGRNALVFQFSGMQSESSLLLQQLVPVQPGVAYRLDFRYETEGLAENTGVRWTAYPGSSKTAEVLARMESLTASQDTQLMTFDVPPTEESAIRLVLEYERFPGTTRKRGRFQMSHFAFYPSDQAKNHEAAGEPL